MIQMQSVLHVADNSGAKKVMCIKVIGGSHRMSAACGDIVVISVKVSVPGGKVKKGGVHRALIVRTKSPVKRSDGGTIKFDSNAVVLLDKQNDPLGTRIFGPLPREIRSKGHTKIVSLAEEVI